MKKEKSGTVNIVSIERKITKLETELSLLKEEFYVLKQELSSDDIGEAEKEFQISQAVRQKVEKPSVFTRLKIFFKKHFPHTLGDIERLLGENLLGKLGILVLVLAVAWFIQYAFVERWLNESARIVLGLFLGFLIFLWALFLFKRAYHFLAPAVLGAAVAILYISWFSAYYFYYLLNFKEGFAGLVLLSLFLLELSGKASSLIMYIFAMSGAFLAPYLMSSGENHYLFLFSYVVFLNALYFYTCLKFNNKKIVFISYFMLAANVLVFYSWADEYLRESSFALPFFSLVFFHSVVLYLQTIFLRTKNFELNTSKLILLILNFIFFNGSSLLLFSVYFPLWKAHFLLSEAFLLLAYFYVYQRKFTKDNLQSIKLKSLLLSFVLILLFLALGVFFKGSLLTLSYIALAGSLSVFTSRINFSALLKISLFIWFIALIRLLFWEPRPYNFHFLFNSRFALYLSASFLLGLSAYFRAKYFQKYGEDAIYKLSEKRKKKFFSYFLLFSFFSVLIIFTGSIKEVHDAVISPYYRNLSYSYTLIFYALVFLVPGFMKSYRFFRYSALVFLVLLVLKLYLYDIWTMTSLIRILAGFSLGLILLFISLYYQKFRMKFQGKNSNE